MNNPQWASRLVSTHCDAIRAEAARLSLPMPKLEDDCKIVGELGSGHYGTVYQTETPGIVFKITSDETEAHFVATAIKLRKSKDVDPEGIVEYFAILALPEKFKNRNVFILWREEAVSVGIKHAYGKDYESVSKNTFITLLMRFKQCAHEAKLIADHVAKKSDVESYWSWIATGVAEPVLERMSEEYSEKFYGMKNTEYGGDSVVKALVDRYKGDPKRRFSWLIECCHQFGIEMMNENQYSYLVGGALGDYLDAGILLADIHTNNIGVVDRPDHTNAVVITDPGHSVVLKRSLASPEIKILEEK